MIDRSLKRLRFGPTWQPRGNPHARRFSKLTQGGQLRGFLARIGSRRDWRGFAVLDDGYLEDQ